MITDLPLIKGKDSILSIVDHRHTKGIILIPCNKSINSNGISQLLLDKVYTRFRCLDSIISDRGPQFALKSFRERLKKALGTDTFLTTAYHPQGDGTTERFNQELKHTSQFIVQITPNPGSTLLDCLNSHTTTADMQTKPTPPSNSCME
jgi:IS30 family transposase